MCDQQARLGRRRLDHRAVRREIAAQDGEAAAAPDRIVQGADDIVVVDFGAVDVFAQRVPVTVRRRDADGRSARQQRPHAAGVIEILHQEGAGRA